MAHATPAPIPKSYLPPEKREALLHTSASANSLYLSESDAADDAGDEEAAWAWLSLVEWPAQSLMRLKRRTSAQFIRDKKFNTAKADEVYGPGWLDRPCAP
jgi:hypothetical protein